jgi:signal transduction histidine kinase
MNRRPSEVQRVRSPSRMNPTSQPEGNGGGPDGRVSAPAAEPGPAQGLVDRDASTGDSADSHARQEGRPSRLSLKNWRVRSRLLLLVIIPTLTAIVLGGIHIYSSTQSAFTYQRAEERALAASDIIRLAQLLENERDQTVYYIALGSSGRLGQVSKTASQAVRHSSGQQYQVVQAYYRQTDQAVTQVKARLTQFEGSYPSLARPAVATALAQLGGLPYLRHAAAQSLLPSLVVLQKYADLINDLIVVNDQTAQGTGDPVLSQTAQVMGLVSRMKEEASEQRAVLSAALLQDVITPAQISALNAAQANQQSSQQAFDLAATASQREQWNASVSGSFVNLIASEEQQAITLQDHAHSLANDPTTVDGFYSSISDGIDNQMGSVERALAADVIARSNSLRTSAVTSAIVVSAVVLIVLALAFWATIMVGRSMVRPLRRLRAGALDVAGSRLPETVSRISEGDDSAVSSQVEPIEVDSTDEIGEVARAFDQVHRQAVKLAANEAALRGNVNAMFVNLSRRTQSLVQRQIHLIDDLEQGEQDSDRLGSLFRLDHLATRMRRNSENLLVLAGHEASQRWSQPVGLVDVLRAAVSEIEQYERISLNVQPGISVRGQVVNDVVHLLAELLENATSFSSAESQVTVSGHLLNSGGVLLDITDQGVGMPADEMKDANWRLDNPPVVDVAVSRRMGLFVVARLASRHGIRVRLRPGPTGGLTALIWLPDETVTYEAAGSPPGLERFDVDTAAAEFSGYPPLDATATDGGSSREAAVAAARVPRFTADDPDAVEGKGRPEIDEERTDDTGPVHAIGAQVVGSTNDLVGTQSASNRSDQADQAERRERDDAGERDDSETRFGLTPRISSWSQDSQAGDVVVPPAMSAGDNRLPIFESVESDWFRRGRHEAISAMSDQEEPAYRPAEIANGWSSPADEGWRAAEALESPSAAGLTPAGLPRRVPQANLVPGGVTEQQPAYQAAPTRSAATTRQRMASFQRGAREGRAALRSDESSGTESEEDT